MLANEPDHPQSLHLYGVPQFRRGAADQAEALLDQSIAIAPDGCTLSDLGCDRRARVDRRERHRYPRRICVT
ncbi:hypothetical protein [Burkholderia contaminans]|uniref:hypothetical protein n=1 Tax=Burkholderia contaminans TaxID=488447 RepID=UPI00158406BD|nr:hypothetical protein [Burkholderia contaminans]